MGAIRLFLALSVVAGHAKGSIFGFYGAGAFVAVNAFFIISGFYMALVLNREYTTGADNVRFYLNRLFRLLPVYFIALALSVAINIYYFPDWTRGVLKTLSPGGQAYFFLSNLFVIGQDLPYVICIPTNIENKCADPVWMALNPPSWSISVELMFYAVAPFVVRSLGRTAAFLIVGGVYLVLLAASPTTTEAVGSLAGRSVNTHILQYYFFPASIMFFGLGAVAYHISEFVKTSHTPPPWAYGIALGIVLLLSKTTSFLLWWVAILFAGSIPLIFALTKNIRFDRFVGELSYPVYMFHFPIIELIRLSVGQSENFVLVVAGVTLALSIVAVVLVDKPVEKYRHSIRMRQSPIPMPAE